MEYYQTMRYLHIFGVSMFIGNMLVTALLKGIIGANKTPNLVAFGQRFIIITDIVFYGLSTMLITASGVYMNPDFLDVSHLNYGFWLYVAVGIIWLFYFIPIQIKQSRLSKGFKNGSEIPPLYWKLEKMWTAGGIVAMLIVFSILYFMVFKPV